MTDKQKTAYEWAKSHPDYRSIAAGHARELAGLVDELTAELNEESERVSFYERVTEMAEKESEK